MKRWLLMAVALGLAALAGWYGRGLLPAPGADQAQEKEPLYWVAPMDPSYRRDKPGKSPMGMDLVPVYEEDKAGSKEPEGLVKISPTVEHNLGIRVGEVRKEPLPKIIQTCGYIQFNEGLLSHIHTRVEGWVEELAVDTVGDPVAAGQRLFTLYAPELVNAQQEFLTALRSGNARLLRASRQRLLALGFREALIDDLRDTRRIRWEVPFHAEQGGIVSDLAIREGMYVKPAMEVMAIGQLDSVWVIAEVFERQIGWLEPDQAVTMRVASYPGRTWQGKVAYIYPVLESKTRTAKVRVRFKNPEQRLKPNMYARLTIQAGDQQPRLSVPRSAVIRGGRFDRVVKVVGEGEYHSVRVVTGIESQGRVVIREGLTEDDQVVTSGQFLIDSESSIDAGMQRMDTEDAP